MKNFIIVGTQRTGSSALAESIGLNSKISCGGELTLHVPYSRKLKAAQRALDSDFSLLTEGGRDFMLKKFSPMRPWLGFRWLFHSSDKWIVHPRFSPVLWLDRLEDFLRWIVRRPDIHIIHIVRHQGLDWLKSVYVARKAKVYSRQPYPEGIKVRIPKRAAIFRLRAKDWIDYRVATLTNTNPYLRLQYEDFAANQIAITASALEFLQCDPTNMRISERRLRKQSKGGVADYVLNYDELLKTLVRLDLLISRFDRL